jgi:hypothetical protein
MVVKVVVNPCWLVGMEDGSVCTVEGFSTSASSA